jgi:hypothetical protein
VNTNTNVAIADNPGCDAILAAFNVTQYQANFLVQSFAAGVLFTCGNTLSIAAGCKTPTGPRGGVRRAQLVDPFLVVDVSALVGVGQDSIVRGVWVHGGCCGGGVGLCVLQARVKSSHPFPCHPP